MDKNPPALPMREAPDTFRFLRQVMALSLLNDEDLDYLRARLETQHFAIGQVVCRAGDAADSFYLLYSGRARVIAGTGEGERTVGTLSRGDHFGEQSLITGETRAYTVRAAEDLVLLRLSRDAFNEVIERRPELENYFAQHIANLATRTFLRLCSTFRALSPTEVQALLDHTEEQEFEAGQTIFREGEPGDRFYVIRSGRARLEQEGRVATHLRDGDFFGELALLTGEGRAGTVVAETSLTVLTLSRESFLRLISQYPRLRANIESVALSYGRIPPELEGRPEGREPPGAVPEELPEEAPPVAPPARPARRWGRRWPVVLQIDENDCGAACLSMVGRHYGREYRLQTLRELSEVSRDGASLRGLTIAAEKLGFRARPVRAQLAHLEGAGLPAIGHWGARHFVVIYLIGRTGVLVADPAIGLRRYSRAEFLKGWTGLALLLEPGDQLASSEESPGLVRRFLPLVRPHWALFMEVLACSLLLQLFGLATPLFTQVVLDRVIVHRDIPLLNLMLAGMAVIVVFQLLTSVLRQWLLVYAVRRIDVSLSVQFLRHMLRLPARYFENMRVGDLVTRFGETENVRRVLTSTAMTVVLDTVTILVCLTVLACYHVGLTLVVLAGLPAFAALGLFATPALVANLRAAYEARAHAESHLVETISGVQTVKAVCAERPVRWLWEDLLLRHIRLQFQSMNYRLLIDSTGALLRVSITASLLWYGARLVIADQLSVGQLMAFYALTATLVGSIERIIGVWNEIQSTRVSLQRMVDVLDTPAEEPHGTEAPPSLPPIRGHIRFEKVTFLYSEEARENAVENIDLEILPGQMVALVGRSGCGKSTLVKLLLRLHEPSSGRILVDGQDVSKVELGSWRRQVGAVLQESFLFSGTIRQNIALGKPDASFDEVRRAAILAGAHEFIAGLPLAYQTLVGERGSSLSGGQRQRINIARALLADPRVLIMDEATSALDTESERAIQRNLDTVLNDRTTLVIAHRLSTIRNADRIVVLDRGVIVEQGTREELVARQGLYYYLCSQQLEQ